MSEPRAEQDDLTGATRVGEGAAERPLRHDHTGHEHDLPTTGVDVDERLDESVDENLHHDHRLVDPDEHVHELPTMGVDVDAALDRAVDENR